MRQNPIFNGLSCFCWFAWAIGALCGAGSANAAEVWTGPATNFAMLSGADWTQATNQDRLTTNVWITRAMTRGIFNAASETGYTSFFSPDGTEWGYGQLTNYASLTYTDWEDWNGHNPPSMVGLPAVLHLKTNDIYLSIQFTSWGGSAGGFAYTRSTPPPVAPPVLSGASTTNVTNFQFSFATAAAQVYSVESRADLIAGTWQSRTNLTGDGSLKTVQFPIDPGNGEFFRVVTH